MFSLTSYSVDRIQRYNIGKLEKTDKEYTPNGSIDKRDPHSGWSLGKFVLTDYTRITKDVEGNLVFLKNVGDEIKLSFNLLQNIDSLNDDPTKVIAYINDGYDKSFDYSEADFGRGLLLIKYNNYQNDPETNIYANYLTGKKVNADTEIKLLEEGDYEIILDYCISDGKKFLNLDHIGKHKILPSYNYYRIYMKFSVRNGNCMVYPFDLKTKSELSNSSYTENGFYLDLANSRYLDIDVKKQVLNVGRDGLIEDTRFNRPVADGAEFVEEGIYVFTVSNRYTNSQTIKKIYVGTNKILKAYSKYSVTGLTIQDINKLIENGSVILDDGTICDVVVPISETNNTSCTNTSEIEKPTEDIVAVSSNIKFDVCYIIGTSVLILSIISYLAFKFKCKYKNKNNNFEENTNYIN